MRISIPNAITSKVGRAVLVGQKNSPNLLFGAGVTGVVGTVVLACRATLKLEEVLKDAEEKVALANTLEHPNYSDEDRQKDLLYIKIRNMVAVVKLYGPAIVVGALSIAALTKSHNILNNRNAALTAAYAALERGFSKYRKRVVDELGEEKDREFKSGLEVYSEIDEKTGKSAKIIGPGENSVYARWFDEVCRNWSPTAEYNRLFLQCQQNYANDLLHSRGHVFLNEVYDMLGLERSKAGAVVGWVVSKTGDNFIDFGIFDAKRESTRDFINGHNGAVLLDFNVDGVIYDKI